MRLVCRAIGISDTGYRYQLKLSDENAVRRLVAATDLNL